MIEQSKLEIPEAARQMAEQSVRQARDSYDRFVALARKMNEQLAGAPGPAADSARRIQEQIARHAEQNAQSGFEFAMALARASDVKQYMDVYQRFAQTQAAAYTSQAQALSRIMADLAKT